MKGLSIAYLLALCLPILVAAYFMYGRSISRIFGEDRLCKSLRMRSRTARITFRWAS